MLYIWVAASNPDQEYAVRRFAFISLVGLATALLGGILGGDWQYILWGATIVLDIYAATLGSNTDGWNLHPEHFTERHGLFVIIALGETLIVAATGITDTPWTLDLIAVTVLAVAITCGLWWIYFTQLKPLLDHVMARLSGVKLSNVASEVYSILHFPMLCGVIAYAVAIEAAVAHPDAPLEPAVLGALSAGLLLFAGSTSLAVWRTTGHFTPVKLVSLGVAVIAMFALPDAPAMVSLLIVLLSLIVIAFVAKHPVSQLDLVESANI